MTRHKRGQNRKVLKHLKSTLTRNNNVTDRMDKENFVRKNFSTTTTSKAFMNVSNDQHADQHLPYYSIFKGRVSRQINSTLSLYSVLSKTEAGPWSENNSSPINSPSSIAELVMKGGIDKTLVQVTTAKPTIIIYPTGNFNIIICILIIIINFYERRSTYYHY